MDFKSFIVKAYAVAKKYYPIVEAELPYVQQIAAGLALIHNQTTPPAEQLTPAEVTEGIDRTLATIAEERTDIAAEIAAAQALLESQS